jgi:hypothetical protein
MPSAVGIVIVLAACAAVAGALLYPVGNDREPLITVGPGRKPTAGRILAVVFLFVGGTIGVYAMAQRPGWQTLVLAPLFYFVLVCFVAPNRFIERFLLRPFLVYVGAFFVTGVVLVAGPALWQAFWTREIPLVHRVGRGLLVSVDGEPLLFWWSVFASCLWIWMVLAMAKHLLVRHRRGWPLSRYLPKAKEHLPG